MAGERRRKGSVGDADDAFEAAEGAGAAAGTVWRGDEASRRSAFRSPWGARREDAKARAAWRSKRLPPAFDKVARGWFRLHDMEESGRVDAVAVVHFHHTLALERFARLLGPPPHEDYQAAVCESALEAYGEDGLDEAPPDREGAPGANASSRPFRLLFTEEQFVDSLREIVDTVTDRQAVLDMLYGTLRRQCRETGFRCFRKPGLKDARRKKKKAGNKKGEEEVTPGPNDPSGSDTDEVRFSSRRRGRSSGGRRSSGAGFEAPPSDDDDEDDDETTAAESSSSSSSSSSDDDTETSLSVSVADFDGGGADSGAESDAAASAAAKRAKKHRKRKERERLARGDNARPPKSASAGQRAKGPGAAPEVAVPRPSKPGVRAAAAKKEPAAEEKKRTEEEEEEKEEEEQQKKKESSQRQTAPVQPRVVNPGPVPRGPVSVSQFSSDGESSSESSSSDDEDDGNRAASEAAAKAAAEKAEAERKAAEEAAQQAKTEADAEKLGLSLRVNAAGVLGFLEGGARATKHSRSGNPKAVVVCGDKERVYWGKNEKEAFKERSRGGGSSKSMAFADVTAVQPGKTTVVFERKTAAKAPAKNCLSLVAADRSLDLELESRAHVRAWLTGLSRVL